MYTSNNLREALSTLAPLEDRRLDFFWLFQAEVQLQAPVVEYPYVEELPVCINGTTTTSVMITTARVEDPDSTTTGGVARLCSSLWLFWLLVLSALFFRNT